MADGSAPSAAPVRGSQAGQLTRERGRYPLVETVVLIPGGAADGERIWQRIPPCRGSNSPGLEAAAPQAVGR